MGRKRERPERPERLVRPCCSAAVDLETALRTVPFAFPHLPHCSRYREPVAKR